MLSNYTPPQYTRVKHFLSRLRTFYFEDWEKLPLLLDESEKKVFLKQGTLLNPDYLEQQKKEQAEYDQKQAKQGKDDWPLFLNLTQPRYQYRDATTYTFYELDVEDEAQFVSLLKETDNKTLQIPLREIVVTITSPQSFDDSSKVSISYDKKLKIAKSIDEFRDWLKFYLIDRKIKEQVRNLLSCIPEVYSSSRGFDQYVESWVFFDKKRIGLNAYIWTDDSVWYRCLSDDRATLSGWSIHRETMDQHYNIKDQFLLLEKYKIDRYVNLLTDMRLEKVDYWQKYEVSTSTEKELLFFAKECFKEVPKNQAEETSPDSSQPKSTEEKPVPVETKESEQKKPTLVNLDLYHTPWLELLNHVFDVHGEEGIKTVSKQTLEYTIHDYMKENDLPIDSNTDVAYLAKFIRRPEQKAGKNYYDKLKKEKELRKQA